MGGIIAAVAAGAEVVAVADSEEVAVVPAVEARADHGDDTRTTSQGDR